MYVRKFLICKTEQCLLLKYKNRGKLLVELILINGVRTDAEIVPSTCERRNLFRYQNLQCTVTGGQRIQISLHVYRTVALTNRIFTIPGLGDVCERTSYRGRERERERKRERKKERERERKRKTDRQRHRHTYTHIESERKRERG